MPITHISTNKCIVKLHMYKHQVLKFRFKVFNIYIYLFFCLGYSSSDDRIIYCYSMLNHRNIIYCMNTIHNN